MNETFALANMKRQLRCREADVSRVYEAKHTQTSPCAEDTLHRRSRLHFSYTSRCASFAPQFIQEIIKNAPKNRSIFCIRPLVEIISSSFPGSDYVPKYR